MLAPLLQARGVAKRGRQRNVAAMDDVEWRVSDAPVLYTQALEAMEARAVAIGRGEARELIWLLEHPPLYTAGTSADPAELIEARFPVFAAGRGGRYTYHGPGQRVVYTMLDLARRGRDVRAYVHALEGWAIDSLGALGIAARRAEGRIGIWTDDDGREAKIGAIGVRVRRWVTLHGLSINVSPDLSHFGGIVPCGIADHGITSIARLRPDATMRDLDESLRDEFPALLVALNEPHILS